MEPRELLERQVTVVATVGELVATVPVPGRDEQHADGSPGSFLCVSLSTFIRHLQDTVRRSVIYLGRGAVTPWWRRRVTSRDPHDVPSLDRASLRVTSATIWDDVRAAASDWREPVDTLTECWSRLAEEATRLRNAWAEEATRRGQQAEAALGLLEHLVAACDRAMAYPQRLQGWLGDIELALEETREPSHDFWTALLAVVDEAEWLWDASAHLATHHLLETLEDIHFLSLHPPESHHGRTVAEECQRAMKEIRRLLQESSYLHGGVFRVSPLQRLGSVLREYLRR